MSFGRSPSALLACVFVLGIVFGSLLPLKPAHWPEAVAARGAGASAPHVAPDGGQDGMVWARSGNRDARHPVEVVRVIDGDTLEARVHLWPGLEMMTRVRLRGIDAPELKAHCPEERELPRLHGTPCRKCSPPAMSRSSISVLTSTTGALSPMPRRAGRRMCHRRFFRPVMCDAMAAAIAAAGARGRAGSAVSRQNNPLQNIKSRAGARPFHSGVIANQRAVTITGVPTETRANRSMMSSLYIRTQP